jgi:hypothetical protein
MVSKSILHQQNGFTHLSALYSHDLNNLTQFPLFFSSPMYHHQTFLNNLPPPFLCFSILATLFLFLSSTPAIPLQRPISSVKICEGEAEDGVIEGQFWGRIQVGGCFKVDTAVRLEAARLETPQERG